METKKENAVAITKELETSIVSRISQMSEEKLLDLPKDYSYTNAVKAAFLQLQDVKTSDKKPVLEVCTKNSIASAVMKMVTQGLSVAKSQCYFIPYGTDLVFQRSYMGTVALAKRIANLKTITANVIYKNDEFEFEIDTETALHRILKHKSSLANINPTKENIVGAYALLTFNDGSKHLEIMNLSQIEKAWEQGMQKGNGTPHKNFTDQMAKKTVINRALKIVINSSDDSELMEETEIKEPSKSVADAKADILKNANKTPISFDTIDEATIVDEKTAEIITEKPKSKSAEPITDGKIEF